MHDTMDSTTAATRLHDARIACGLQLSDIEQRTRISPSILRWIDDGQFQRLPPGIYARSYVRAFAQAVGLDPNQVVAELEHALPPAADTAAAPVIATPARTRHVAPEWLRFAAAAVDAGILSVVYGLVLGATAAVCGQSVAAVLGPGLPGVVVVLALLTAIYFVIFAGVGGRTPGGRLFGLAPLALPGPVHLDAIVTRALRVFLSEASLGVSIAARRSAPHDASPAAPYGSRSTP